MVLSLFALCFKRDDLSEKEQRLVDVLALSHSDLRWIQTTTLSHLGWVLLGRMVADFLTSCKINKVLQNIRFSNLAYKNRVSDHILGNLCIGRGACVN